MEEENKTQETTEQTSQVTAPKKVNPMIFVGAGLVVILVIGAFLFTQKRESTPNEETMEGTNMTQGSAAEENMESSGEAMTEGDNAMKDSTSPAMTDTAEVDVKVEGGNFYFKPNTITVKKGQTVKITLTSADGTHDFYLDEFNVKSESVNAGQSTTVTFTPNKTGSFEYYCSIDSHRAKGMVGTLIVQ